MSKRKAFTIIELTMVIIIVIILSVTGSAAILNALRGIRLVNAADKLTSDLKYAQYMAGNTALWYGVSFEVDPVNRYTLYTTTGTVDTAVLPDPLKPGVTFVVNLNTDYSIKISSATIDGGKKVEFSPNGTPYTDKTAAPTTLEGVITLSNDAATRTVRITPNTGRVFEQ